MRRPRETLGGLPRERLAAYEKLQAELAYEHRREDPRAAIENKKLWISRHKAARAWMTIAADSDGRLPYGTFEEHSQYASGVDLSNALDAYNNSRH